MSPWEKQLVREHIEALSHLAYVVKYAGLDCEHEETMKRLESAGNELERIATLFGCLLEEGRAPGPNPNPNKAWLEEP